MASGSSEKCAYTILNTKLQRTAPEIIHSGNANDAVGKAEIYLFVGITHKCKGNLDQAKNYYTSALDILLKQLGPEHVDVAASYNNLGTVYSSLGDIQQASCTCIEYSSVTAWT